MKFLKVGRVAIITRGRYAGKKVRSIQWPRDGITIFSPPLPVSRGIRDGGKLEVGIRLGREWVTLGEGGRGFPRIA
jgi:hypothetical protein